MHPDLNRVADKIRTTFLEQKAIVFGKKAKVGGRYDKWSYWNQAAEKCLQLQADPERYIAAIFAGCRDPKMLFPNMLYGNMAEQCWAQTQNMPIKEILMAELTSTVGVLKGLTGSTDINSYYNYVQDKWFPMLSYMRLLLFPMDANLLREFGMEAWEFLSTRPEHVEVLDSLGFNYNDFNQFMMTNGKRE